ncbi:MULTISPECIES: DUF1365 domain-containing protein [unclassified Marinobacter]|uniref:DUF1365 domain-containing protein n=1 Tax=unclassified Marinobacter TaxID=83889 RepID=UPI00200DD311|nr:MULTISPECIES: DUF1365 domain-containing protein [unclassified Marinobacter]UQG54066.1 DUF1365 domain-containing protein [Marinobacter sp. M4C]UQG62873.1 DUF1365 domain-containing protein [Marinobacter sp. M2C]UQG67150.1 DUF1365 domain-containing protein [Marinobacter sp. M1C]
MSSDWLEGSIRHRRQRPVQHEFSYHTGMLALDVDNWQLATTVSPLFSVERFNWLSLYRKDYFKPDHGRLGQALRDYVCEATGWTPDGKIELITHPRYFGYVFNPVSFYFCYTKGDNPATGAVPRVIIAQITNTPWHDRHAYCLETVGHAANKAGWRSEQFEFEKRFHVSPFNGMHQSYRWTFSFRGPQLRVHMSVMEENTRQFDATLVVQRKPLSRKILHTSLRQFPLEALKVSARIYWHALKLKLKGAPFYSHPDKLEPNDPAFRLGQEDCGLDLVLEQSNDQSQGTSGKVSSWRI